MQNKGALKVLIAFLAIACLYQLSFTFLTRGVEKDAVQYAASFDESLRAKKEQDYLDSMRTQTVMNLGFIKFNYKEAKEKELNLGLDLKGGMNVMLEISVEDVVRVLANNSKDPSFNQALSAAVKEQQGGKGGDFVDLFAKQYAQISNNAPLAYIFNTPELKDHITAQSSNEEVVKVIKEQADGAIENSFNVLRNRIDRFGVAQPNVQRLENSGRILVELPGVKEPERVRKLLQGTASLEFWSTYDNKEVYGLLLQADQITAKYNEAVDNGEVKPTENLPVEGSVAGQIGETDDLTALLDENQTSGDSIVAQGRQSLLQKLILSQTEDRQAMPGPVVGFAKSSDTAAVNKYLALPQVRAIMPRDINFKWGVKAVDQASTLFELYAIRVTTRDGKAPLDGGVIVNARPEYAQQGSSAIVTMAMNTSGSKVWARMTADNTGKSIAIVLDDYVYSAPRVPGEITGGRSEIKGSFTIQEATDLANVLKSGKLPAPARIIQDTVVGPSLGQESIDAGLMSFVLAFVLVLIYMIMFYSTAGLVANIVLISNLFFLLGILTSFSAVLTLPGIAGIVLTMGMAVDANVIIYERIKEELKAGKGINLAVADGFKNAMSAIVDGNMTTIITGVVLFFFGTGPVQGFATTLIIGILTSLLTAIFVTQLVFSAMLERGMKLKFSNKVSQNFLTNIHFDFIKVRKYTYVVSAILFVATAVSLITRGLSYGVDFSGGRAYVVRFDQNVTANDVRKEIETGFSGVGCEVKQFGSENQMRIVTQYKFDDAGDNVTDEVNEKLYNAILPLYKDKLTLHEFVTNVNPYGIISSDKVGPSVAHDIKRNAIIAVLFALLAIGLYVTIRFKKWQWAVGGVTSLVHDAFITIGMFSMLWGLLPFNLEVDQAFIAAILTIIGYSINDTVIIFDRIREYNVLYPRRSMKDNINNAINSTLSRTFNTAGTTSVVLLAIFIFGGEVIRGFVFTLLFGVIIGTFSSVFVATPVAYDLIRRNKKKE